MHSQKHCLTKKIAKRFYSSIVALWFSVKHSQQQCMKITFVGNSWKDLLRHRKRDTQLISRKLHQKQSNFTNSNWTPNYQNQFQKLKNQSDWLFIVLNRSTFRNFALSQSTFQYHLLQCSEHKIINRTAKFLFQQRCSKDDSFIDSLQQ